MPKDIFLKVKKKTKKVKINDHSFDDSTTNKSLALHV